MRQSKLFTKVSKESPKDETSKNAQLLTRGGFVHKEMAGVHSYLPLGLRVIEKIEDIIREEMNAVGGVEMRTSALQCKEVWEKSNRWDDELVDNWFKTKLKNGVELGLSFTNEEAYSNLLKQYVGSYKDLPIYPYDFKAIFRNELRTKSGIMRGREFYWKAMYSFSKDEKEHLEFYERMKDSYKKIFEKVGIGHLTYLTWASGGTFSEFSHEFQTICDAGEDIIYISKNDYGKGLEMEKGRGAVNKEIWTDDLKKEMGMGDDFEEKKAIEVGNIFTLGTKFSEPFDLKYKDETGKEKLVFMGSYGIGLGRLMGTVVEIFNDEKGIIWPETIAPFRVHLLRLGNDDKVKKESDSLYQDLQEKKVEVLYDDREDKSAGEKFAEADLLGIPWRVVVSEKTVAEDKIEVKRRESDKVEMLDKEDLFKKIL
ncbi:MAG: aminoacyl--tRNA ligase-related protein [Patescibacteria group bacterium]